MEFIEGIEELVLEVVYNIGGSYLVMKDSMCATNFSRQLNTILNNGGKTCGH